MILSSILRAPVNCSAGTKTRAPCYTYLCDVDKHILICNLMILKHYIHMQPQYSGRHRNETPALFINIFCIECLFCINSTMLYFHRPVSLAVVFIFGDISPCIHIRERLSSVFVNFYKNETPHSRAVGSLKVIILVTKRCCSVYKSVLCSYSNQCKHL